MMAPLSLFFVATVCAAQESPWIILATQGNQKHEVHIGQSSVDSFTTFGAPRGTNLAGHRVRAWKQGDRVYFTLAELKTKSGQVWDGHSFDQVFEIPIGSAQLSPDFPTAIVGAYQFRLIRDPGGCGVTVPDIGNLTRALQLDRIEYDYGSCHFIVRNISSRSIVAVILGIQKGGSGSIEFHGATGIYETTDLTLRLLMAPGETARAQSHIGKPPGAPLNIGRYGPISLAAVIFDDESWNGDGKIAIGLLARRAGSIAQKPQILRTSWQPASSF